MADEASISEATAEEKAHAVRLFGMNRDSLVSFYKGLASMSENPVPKDMAGSSTSALDETEARMLTVLSSIQLGEFEPAEAARPVLDKVCLASFLLERCRKIRESALAADRISVFSLYISLEEGVCDLLSESYYGLPSQEIIDKYLDIEPLLSVCSEICGMQVPELEEAITDQLRRFDLDIV
ncbi:MAG: hypothetical protein V1827_00430 [Candidatus Micrarchaeota archaeon]